MLKIKNLHVKVEGKEILKGIDLAVSAGQVHAIMGPNASGKSTLAKVLAGHPAYKVTQGSIEYNGKNIFKMEVHERALAGIFLGFQYPVEVPGLTNSEFLRSAYNALQRSQQKEEMDPMDFENFLQKKIEWLNMEQSFSSRGLNVDFSGGEKKRNEIIQMAVLEPKLAVLDETDSGLDIDSLKIVSEGINKLRTDDNAMVVITHYQRILNYVVPDVVHIIHEGKIIESGDKELALHIEERGYGWILE